MFNYPCNLERKSILLNIENRLGEKSSKWYSGSCREKEDLILREILQAGHIILDHINKFCNLDKNLLDFKKDNSDEKLHALMLVIISNMPSAICSSLNTENKLIILLLERDLCKYKITQDKHDNLISYVENINLDLIDDDEDLQSQTKKFYFACQSLNRDIIDHHLDLISMLPKVLDNDNTNKRILLWQKTIFSVILERINFLLAKKSFNMQLQTIRNKVVTQIELVDKFLKSFDKNQCSWANSLLCFSFGAKCKEQDDFVSPKKLYRFNNPS